MIPPYRFRQKAVTFAISAGNYNAASEIYRMPLDRFRHGIPPDVFRLIYNRRQKDIDTAPEMRYNQNDDRRDRREKQQEVKKMKHLYEANDNYQNYILIRDFDREENDTIICDWDLSEDEVETIREAFERGEYDEKECVSDDTEWMTWEQAQQQFNSITAL